MSKATVTSHQRARIRRALVEIVAEGGYQTLTARRLASLARISTGTLYARFGGTEACFFEAYTAFAAQTRGRILSLRTPGNDPADQLASVLAYLSTDLIDERSVARLMLIDVFGAGPGVVDRVQDQEATFKRAVRECLSRRGRRLDPLVADWLAAGSLRAVERHLLDEGCRSNDMLFRDLSEWAIPFVGGRLPDLSRRALSQKSGGRSRTSGMQPALFPANSVGNGERSLLLSAFVRLARSSGHCSFSAARLSKAAGIPTTRFNRHFQSSGDCALAGVRTVVTACFSEFTTRTPSASPVAGIYRAVSHLCDRVAANPLLARSAFVGVMELGVAGVRCRERLTSDVAAVWHRRLVATECPNRPIAEISVDALWTAIASHLHRGDAARLPGEALTLSFLLATPLVGASVAEEILTRLEPDYEVAKGIADRKHDHSIL